MILSTADPLACLALAVVVGVAWGIVAPMMMQAGGAALSAWGNSRAATTDAATARRIADQEDQARRDMARMETARAESQANPYTQLQQQTMTAQGFDEIARAQPLQIDIPGLDPRYKPQLRAGYQPSQQIRDMGAAGRDMVLQGRGTTPTMTNPDNFGATGVQNFWAAPPPGPGGAPGAAPTSRGPMEAAPTGADASVLTGDPGTTGMTPGVYNYLMRAYGGEEAVNRDPQAFLQWLDANGFLPGMQAQANRGASMTESLWGGAAPRDNWDSPRNAAGGHGGATAPVPNTRRPPPTAGRR